MRLTRVIVPLLATLLVSSVALGQDYGGPVDPDLVVQRFTPITGPDGVFTVDGSRSQGHLQLAAGLMLNYSHDPLVLEVEGESDTVPIVEDQLVADVLFNVGLFDVLEVGLALPVYGVNSATVGDQDLSGATIGDLRVRPKFTLLDREDAPVGVAAIAHITLPTGDDAAFTSSGGVSARPGFIVDLGDDDLLLTSNLAFDIQGTQDFGNLEVGSAFLYGLGLKWQFAEDVYLGTEIFGATSFNNAFSEQNSPMEGVLGVEYHGPAGIRYTVGAGKGLVGGFGAPAYRVFGGIKWAMDNRDTDGDGLYDDVDKCPLEPEDKDGFEDDDGCPDLDNDNDGLPDTADTCPNEPEDVDSFEDIDGCPDPDNDQDGVLDVVDDCPIEPGPAENKGCPIGDTDKDGLLDNVDKCPLEPEDKDGFEDEDGCPDPDNDKDGILDANDLCPNEPETINGFEDEDGCPDKGEVKVILEGDEIKILDRVYFDTAKATIKERSFSLLNQVALTLRANPQITLIEVQGHTDDRGGDDYNRELSDQRANAVRDYLIGKGIDAKKLKARGYGEDAPAVKIDKLKGRKLNDARGKNRRVQFVILEQNGEKVRTR